MTTPPSRAFHRHVARSCLVPIAAEQRKTSSAILLLLHPIDFISLSCYQAFIQCLISSTFLNPLTRHEFVALARSRGYRLADIARLWGISRSRVSQIAADPERAPYWDYALWAVPARTAKAVLEARRRRLLASLPPPVRSKAAPTRELRRDSPGGLGVELGDVWIVRDSPGEHLPERCEGTVRSRFVHGGLWHVIIHFPVTGYEETFTLAYLQQPDCFLSATGSNTLRDALDRDDTLLS